MTRSRRAFAGFSKFATPSPLILLPPRAISSSFFIHPLSTPSLFRARLLPAGSAILKLNTADDSRALPRLASARKRSGGEISVLQELRILRSFFLPIFLVLSSFSFSFISLYVLFCVMRNTSTSFRDVRIENGPTGAYRRCSQEYREISMRF